MAATAPIPRQGVSRREAGAIVVLLLLGGVILGRRLPLPSLEFDEQVYLASADLLTRGLQLGRDVFTSQPPLFLTALDWASVVFGGNAMALRGLSVGLTLAGALAAWAIVRRTAGPLPAFATAALVICAPGVVEAAAVVSADVPCVALGTASLLAAQAARRVPAWGFAAGALLACALLVKLLAAPFAIALAVAAIVHRPPPRAFAWFAVGVATVLGAVGLAYFGVLGALWDGAVGLHLEARGAHVEFRRPSIVVEATLIALAYVGLLAILAAGLIAAGPSGIRTWARDRADLIALTLAGLAFCAVQRPLLNHHLVIVAWPLALLAGSALPPDIPRRRPAALALAGLALVLPWVLHGRDTVDAADRRELARTAQVVAAATAPQERVVSDLPLVALLADRPAAPETVDPSYVRVSTQELSRAEILAAANRAGAVVVGRAFMTVPGLDDALARRFPRRTNVGRVRIYTRR